LSLYAEEQNMKWKFVRRILSFFLAWLMVNPSGPSTGFGKDDPTTDAQRAGDVKAAVLKLGTGKNARVLVNLLDSEKVGGYVQQTQDDGLSVRVFCSGNDIPVPFARIRGLRGVNVATGMKVSAGKGVSEKVNALLATDDPCGTTIIEAKRIGPNPLIGIIMGAALVAFVVTIYVMLLTSKD
jgi:hypothetical protein